MTMSATIDASGISAPDQPTILEELKTLFRSIYGNDVNLDPDTQDGQWLAAMSQMISDNNQMAINVFSSFSPSFAAGAQLASLVKINGITKNVATPSTATVLISGDVGTVINNGVVEDTFGFRWNLPSSVTIPTSGAASVTVTAQDNGATQANAHTITKIITPILGWQGVTNPLAAVPGQAVEEDSALRVRQSRSTALPAQAIIEGIYAEVADVNGVERLTIHENDTDTTDSDGVPSHTIAVIVQGGDVQLIAEAIQRTKPPGTGTFGDVSYMTVDSHGVPNTIRFVELEIVPIQVRINIHALPGFTSTITTAIKQAVMDFVNDTLIIGEDSYRTRLFTPANQGGTGVGDTYYVTNIQQNMKPGAPAQTDLYSQFDQKFVVESLDDVNVVLT